MQLPPKVSVALDRLVGPIVSKLHAWLFRLTRGRVGGTYGPADVLVLTTTGRKTGERRAKPLLYLPDGDTYVVVASNGGRPNHPAWYLNLKAEPKAEVQVGPDVIPVVASEASDDEREGLWPQLKEIYPGFDHYTQITDRELPVIRLRRSGRGASHLS